MRLAASIAMGLLPFCAWSQFHDQKHSFTVSAGAAQPRAGLRSLFADGPLVGVAYGFRLHRYFQADAGLDTVFGAAGVRDFLPTQFGDLRIRDYQFFVPLGARAIAPLLNDRIRISGGGGAAYLHYTERIQQPFRDSNFRLDCPVCASRSGWGYYALAAASVAVDRDRHFRVGVTSKVYRGHTEGDPLGSVPALRTRDHWVNIAGEFGFSF
ncbi:MAG TPA: hypothetical protein VMZ52_19065 [Bryobacteraceae bacterium]|nr:hypothetical protein [Bryobacteraceae bacterium]